VYDCVILLRTVEGSIEATWSCDFLGGSESSIAVLVLKLCTETLRLDLYLSSEASKWLCDESALPFETRLRRLCVTA